MVCEDITVKYRKLKGIVSDGMILSALNADGSLTLIAPSSPATPGSQVK